MNNNYFNKHSFLKMIPILCLLILVGCTQQGTDTADGQSTENQTVIAVVPKGVAHIFWQSVHAGALTAGKEFGVQIEWKGPPTETQKDEQRNIVEDFVVKQVDGIVLAPQDENALVPAVEKVAQAKIPCVIFDSGINSDKFVSFVATDNYKGGVMAANEMGRLLNGKGTVIITRCDPGSDSTNKREQGFEDTIADKFPDIKIVDSKYGNSDREESRSVTEDMLSAHPDVDAIFASNESSTTGALLALQSRGVAGKKIFVGFDSSDDLIKAMSNKEINALVLQNPFKMGYLGVKAIVDHLAGRQVEKRIDTGVYLITPKNMDEPQNKELLNPDLSILEEG